MLIQSVCPYLNVATLFSLCESRKYSANEVDQPLLGDMNEWEVKLIDSALAAAQRQSLEQTKWDTCASASRE
jgi:hypothetical protein